MGTKRGHMYYRIVPSKDHGGKFIAQRVNERGQTQPGYINNPKPTGPKGWLFTDEASAIAAAEGQGLEPYTGAVQRSFASLPTGTEPNKE